VSRKPTYDEFKNKIKELEKELAELKGMASASKDFTAYQSVLAVLRGASPEETEESFLQTFLSEIVKQYGFCMSWYGRYENGTIRPKLSAGKVDQYLDNLVLDVRESTSPDAVCAISQAILREAPFSYGDLERDKGFRRWRDYALELGYRSNLAMPLKADGHIEGGVMVYADTPNAFPELRIVRLVHLTNELGLLLRQRRARLKTVRALRESEENFRALAENANDGIMIVVGEGVHVYANKRSSEMTGYSVSELRKITIEDLALPEELEKIKERYRRIIEGQDFPSSYENVLIRKDGKHVPIEVTSARTTWHGEPADLVIFRDITERKQAKETLEKAYTEAKNKVKDRTADLLKVNEELKEEINERKAAEAALRRSNLELALLSRTAKNLTSILELDQVLAKVIEETKKVLSSTGCVIWLRDPETQELVCKQCIGPMCDTICDWRLQAGEGIAGWVVEKGGSLLVPDTRTDRRYYEGIDQASGAETRSILCVPLKSREKVFGAIQVMDECPDFFEKDNLMLMESLAASAAIAIENAQLYQTIQHELTERKRAEDELQWKVKVDGTLAELFKPLISQSTSIEVMTKVISKQSKKLTQSMHGFVSERKWAYAAQGAFLRRRPGQAHA
jgi:PAS domain S-box-containing protein